MVEASATTQSSTNGTRKYTEKTGTYHEDTGEGLDNFHVGKSRGIGGTAIPTDSSYVVSKNFVASKTLMTGPIRTSFVLTYNAVDAEGVKFQEVKTISLDRGQFLSKFDVTLTGVDQLATAIAVLDHPGKITDGSKSGFMSYWKPHDDAELGMGLVFDPKSVAKVEEVLGQEDKEQNHYYVQLSKES